MYKNVIHPELSKREDVSPALCEHSKVTFSAPAMPISSQLLFGSVNLVCFHFLKATRATYISAPPPQMS